MNDLIAILTQLWLDTKEAQIYLLCLQYGMVTATTLARLSKLAISSVYEVTTRLVQHGYIVMHKKPITTYFSATAPEHILALLGSQKNDLQTKIDTMNTHMTDFHALTQYTGQLPQVQYYEGQEALSFFFTQIANANYSYSVFSVDHLIHSIYGSIEELGKNLSHPGVKGAQRILTYSPTAITYKAMVEPINPHIHRKILPPGYEMQAEMTLTDDAILHMSFGDKLAVIEIKHPIYYQSHKMLFDYMWNTLPSDEKKEKKMKVKK